MATWSRDDLLLALDLYWHSGDGSTLAHNRPDGIQLSEMLNQLPGCATSRRCATAMRTRYMKLMNFRRLYPAFQGKSLTRGNRLEEEIWKHFIEGPSCIHRRFERSESVIA